MSKRGAEFYLTDRNFDSYNEEVDDDEEVINNSILFYIYIYIYI